jgi:hypothetical protein
MRSGGDRQAGWMASHDDASIAACLSVQACVMQLAPQLVLASPLPHAKVPVRQLCCDKEECSAWQSCCLAANSGLAHAPVPVPQVCWTGKDVLVSAVNGQ